MLRREEVAGAEVLGVLLRVLEKLFEECLVLTGLPHLRGRQVLSDRAAVVDWNNTLQIAAGVDQRNQGSQEVTVTWAIDLWNIQSRVVFEDVLGDHFVLLLRGQRAHLVVSLSRVGVLALQVL